MDHTAKPIEAFTLRRRELLALGAASGWSLIMGCTPASPAPVAATTPAPSVPARGGVLTIGVAFDAGELDPHRPTDLTTRTYSRALYNTLTNVDTKGNLVPELAESWSAPDAHTWEFKLRKGVKFHDGTDFDANAARFSLERVMDPATRSDWRTELVPNVTGVEVVDALTLRLKLQNPDVTLPARLSGKSGHMVAPSGVTKWGADFATHPVGTGPFELVEWVKDDHLQLKRFEGYWDADDQGNKVPYLDRLVYKPIPDPSVMLTALRTGQIDLMDTILPADVSKAKADPNLSVVEIPGTNQVLWLNLTRPPFDNKALRQAVAWAIDREAILKAIYFDTGTVGAYLTNPQSWAFDASGTFYTHDLAKAKAKLAEAGYPNGFKFDGQVGNSAVPLQYAQAMKSQLIEAGIDMTVLPLATAVLNQRRQDGDFDASYSTAPPDVDPDAEIYPFVKTGSVINRVHYSNSTVDDLLQKARETTDQNERQRYYRQAQPLILDDTPIVFIHRDANIRVMKNTVHGYTSWADTLIGGVARIWLKT